MIAVHLQCFYLKFMSPDNQMMPYFYNTVEGAPKFGVAAGRLCNLENQQTFKFNATLGAKAQQKKIRKAKHNNIITIL